MVARQHLPSSKHTAQYRRPVNARMCVHGTIEELSQVLLTPIHQYPLQPFAEFDSLSLDELPTYEQLKTKIPK